MGRISGRDAAGEPVNLVETLPVYGASALLAAGVASASIALPTAARGYSVVASGNMIFNIGTSGVTAAVTTGGGHFLPSGASEKFRLDEGDTHIAVIRQDATDGTLYISALD